MSCNGCRILRKGCSQNCTLRPSLSWIPSPQSQANATLFLAKFYGRAGLLNLIATGPPHLRPEIFRSLLYEACGRIINPVYGAAGLISSGNWSLCQAAVDAVLRGGVLVPVRGSNSPVGKSVHDGDIRHLSKKPGFGIRCRRRFKRCGGHVRRRRVDSVSWESEEKFTITGWKNGERSPSHDSVSAETVEPALVNRVEKGKPECEMELDLTLGLGLDPMVRAYGCTVIDISDTDT